jgi:ribose transport system ATP-binding protein
MPAASSEILLDVQGLSKAYSGVEVLTDIDLQVRRGEILGIIGENGAGKSTLTKCINGVTSPTRGSVVFEGRARRRLNVSDAQHIGIVTIPQEFNLISDLTVYENIFLGREWRGKHLLLDRKGMRKRACELLSELNAAVDPDSPVRHLSVADKQMVEIAKALATDCRLMIMDEPTTVLNQQEVATLFALMRRLRDRGTTIIYISHKLPEVKTICDRVLVLRDGHAISIDPTGDLTEAEMARRMVGREMNQMFPPKRSREEHGPVALSVRNLSVADVIDDISFDLRQGEILGFAGLVGAGRTELAETIYGIRRPTAGTLAVHGSPARIRSPGDAVRQGIAYLSEDRQGTGVLTNFTVTTNTTLVSLRKYARILIDRRKEKEKAQHYVDAFNIKTEGLDTRLEHLSGGNQQKVALAKGLDPEPRIFIFDEPTRGIDVNAKGEIYAFIHRLVSRGIACILISSDLEEVIGMCRRVAVMRGGRLAGFVEDDHVNEHDIMLLATGVT